MLDCSGGRFDSQNQLILVDAGPQISVAWWGVHGLGVVPPEIFKAADDISGGSRGWEVTSQSLKIRFRVARATTDFVKQGITSHSNGTVVQHHVVTWNGEFANSSVRIWMDGVENTINELQNGTGNHTFGTTDVATLGHNLVSGEVGDIGWFAIWGRELFPAEAVQLSHKKSPLHFPDRLLSYWQLNNEKYATDRVGNVNLIPKAGDTPTWVLTDIDIVEPPRSGFLLHQHNPVPDANTVFPGRRKGYRIRKVT